MMQKVFKWAALSSLLLFQLTFAGDKAQEKPTDKSSQRYENLTLFNKVLHFIQQNYVEQPSDEKLIRGAIRGMLETLDPHSNLLAEEVYRDMKIDTSGKFGGIGLEVTLKDNILTVISPLEDSPAFDAGILAGDRIVKIEGESTKGLSLSDAVAKMRGKRGSAVRMGIWRPGFSKPKDFLVKRSEIKIQAVKSEAMEPGYFYARLTNFNENAAKDLASAMERAEKRNGPLKGMVLDLRNNPGGLLDQAVDVSSLFIDEGVIVSTRGRTKEVEDVRRARAGMARKNLPLVVLVNGASASASEIVAGALQDYKRAVVMGQPTFGKGSVQTVVEVAPDLGLKLTVARYYTPQGRSIQLKGIEPDILLDDYDPKILEQARRKPDGIHEKDLKRRMEGEFQVDELLALEEEAENNERDEDGVPAPDAMRREKAKLGESRESRGPASVVGVKASLAPAADDFQVKQALNYLKGYHVLRAMSWGTSVHM